MRVNDYLINEQKKSKKGLKPLFKRQMLVTSLSVFLILVITLATSVAIFTKTGEGSEYNVVQVGDLELSYVDLNDEGNVLQLADSYPLSDSEGEASTPYRFSVENTGTIIANYTVKILQDTDTINADGCSDNLLDDSYLRYKFDNGTSQNLKDKLNASNEYVVYSGTLEPFESSIHEIRLWITENSPNSVLGTHYHGKVVIDVEQNNLTNPNERPVKPSIPNTLNLESKVDTATTINFAQISSATNGRGIYKYQEDGEDIYYWRGKVTDNHIVFAGFCWEGVRTTKTGGLKMIYDGVPATLNGKQTCSNTGSESRLSVGHIAFNPSDSDNAYIGYMYGLTGVNTELNNPQCIKLNSTRTQAEVGGESTEAECIANGGKWATTAYEATHANIVDSTIKTAIDTWFSTSNLNTTENLKRVEDAVYCNDRTIDQNLGAANGYTGYTMLGYGKNLTIYHSTARVGINLSKPMPSLGCNQKKDRFTVSEENGNGDLTYPVGLLTADESALAGGVFDQSNNDYYLHTGSHYHLLSPYRFGNSGNYTFLVYSSGKLSSSVVINLYGIRPVISLSPSVLPNLTGTGTETSPYVINVN